MKKAKFIALLALALLIMACSTDIIYEPVDTSGFPAPDDPAVVGSWERAGMVFHLYNDGYFEYFDADTLTLQDYGQYICSSGSLTFNSYASGDTVIYPAYQVLTDYNGVIGQSAIEMETTAGSLIYWVEWHY